MLSNNYLIKIQIHCVYKHQIKTQNMRDPVFDCWCLFLKLESNHSNNTDKLIPDYTLFAYELSEVDTLVWPGGELKSHQLSLY